jgi:hypothetical protein
MNTYPIVSGPELDQIVRQIERAEAVHHWEPLEIIKCLAYLLPGGLWMDEATVVTVFNRLDRQTRDPVYLMLVSAQQSEILTSRLELVPGSAPLTRFRMDRKHKSSFEKMHGWKLVQPEPEPEKAQVSKHLRDLKLPHPDQQVFLQEAIACLEVSAFRAAIVMTWVLTYDHLCRWILVKHLAAFNAELTKPRRGASHDPVACLDDFPDKEYTVLETCEKAGLLPVKEKKDLLFYSLKTRNQYAHPSSSKGSAPIASGYIANLVENILLDPHFAI